MRAIASVFITAFFLLVSTPSILAQQITEAIKIDEFGKLNCGDLLARIDNLYLQLENNPDASAFIVIHPKKGLLGQAAYRKKFIEDVFMRRRFDLSRLRIVRGDESEPEAGAFYLLPTGAADPIKEAGIWPEEKLNFTSPLVFGSEGDEDPCPSFPFPKYAEIIKSNPNLRGHIVIFPYPGHSRNAALKKWIRVLTTEYKIPRGQLRFFFGKAQGYSYTEFWVVPVKRK
jgi:hypothetical protein